VTPIVSIVAIASGGSAGPEGPVLYIGAAIGQLMRFTSSAHSPPIASPSPPISAASDWRTWWRLSGGAQRPTGEDALIGGAAAIAAFFDHPVSGCLFVMELPHMHGSMHKGNVVRLPTEHASFASALALMGGTVLDACVVVHSSRPPSSPPPSLGSPIAQSWTPPISCRPPSSQQCA
jgi:H+/Cl- antiporter ClcA